MLVVISTAPSFMLDFSCFDSLVSLVSFFETEDVCKSFLADARWGEDVVCPYCGAHGCHRCSDGRFLCSNRECHKKFGVKVGTVFESSNLPLKTWFMGIYLVSSHKRGISSYQLARDLGVTQKTAWFMEHKIRSCFGQDDSVALVGHVEGDEAYVGGDEKWKHESKKVSGGQGGANKTPIFGLISREDDRVVAVKVPNTKGSTILPLINQFVGGSDTVVYTDESVIYNALHKKCGFKHLTCNHANKEFSDGNGITTNSIEGFWSHFKRMIKGTYFHFSEDYTQRYIDEECFRWNTKDETEGKRFELFFKSCIGRCSFSDVVSLSSVVKKVA